jgi:hypothetical protein
MSRLLDLSNKLLLQIYESLSDVDDIFYLAQCSRRLPGLLEDGFNRLKIFKRVIVYAMLRLEHKAPH